MTAQILTLTANKDTDLDEFEAFLQKTVLPKLQVLQRNVLGTSTRLFRADSPAGTAGGYVVLVFAQMGSEVSQPVLWESLLPMEKIVDDIRPFATWSTLDEVTEDPA